MSVRMHACEYGVCKCVSVFVCSRVVRGHKDARTKTMHPQRRTTHKITQNVEMRIVTRQTHCNWSKVVVQALVWCVG